METNSMFADEQTDNNQELTDGRDYCIQVIDFPALQWKTLGQGLSKPQAYWRARKLKSEGYSTRVLHSTVD